MSIRILKGDCRNVLPALPDESVQCVVTSPPYWRQRDYGSPGQIGLEATPEEYIAELVKVFSEVRRVLRSDGTCWINIGDKWASGGNGGGGSFMADRGEAWAHAKGSKGWRKPPHGYKDKDLVGLPFMLAFAMRADGWYWRQCNIWAKPNCMPESVSDRSTAAHEYVLHFSKRNDYYYNAEAAKTPPAPTSVTRLKQNVEEQAGSLRANGGAKTNGPMRAVFGGRNKSEGYGTRRASGREDEGNYLETGANLRSVWWLAPASSGEAHFAMMPESLAEICIACGTCPGQVVLDPFGGAGTTGLVSDRMGRDAVLIELNPAYALLAENRLRVDAGMFSQVAMEQF